MKRFIIPFGLALFASLAAAQTPVADDMPVVPEPSPALSSYILLDRTGSMSDIWDEALSSVNAYAAGLAEDDDGPAIDNSVTLAAFDFQDGFQFDVLRDGVTASDWTDVTNGEANPRGMTPLFDAIGRMVSVAETDDPDKAIIVIMTDGAENSSREFTRDTARAALDRAEAKGWEVVFLGAEFARFDDAEAAGVSASRQMAVDKDYLGATMNALAQKSKAYSRGDQEEVEFDDADRALAQEEAVKLRQR